MQELNILKIGKEEQKEEEKVDQAEIIKEENKQEVDIF